MSDHVSRILSPILAHHVRALDLRDSPGRVSPSGRHSLNASVTPRAMKPYRKGARARSAATGGRPNGGVRKLRMGGRGSNATLRRCDRDDVRDRGTIGRRGRHIGGRPNLHMYYNKYLGCTLTSESRVSTVELVVQPKRPR